MSDYLPDMIVSAMSTADMAKHIARMATILGVEIPSSPSGASVFTSRMESVANRGAQWSKVIAAYQDSHLKLMRV